VERTPRTSFEEVRAARSVGATPSRTRFLRTPSRVSCRQSVEAFGRLDIVVNNAGYANVGSIEELSEEDWRAQIETNLWSVIHVTRAALPILRQQRSGHFLQISSIGGRSGTAGLGPYRTSKWAVEGFSEVLLREVAPLSIKVTLIEPGGFRTDWAGSSMSSAQPSEDYQSTLQAFLDYHHHAGSEPGDPDKGAQAMLSIVDEEQPPLRLPLGTDAIRIARSVDQAKLDETERWLGLSLSTDFDTSANAFIYSGLPSNPSGEKK
jgi:NAD(P)-dependent dehydrogenase (short-subunit alcohol dehydrogenase family)